MPYQPPSPNAADTAIVEVEVDTNTNMVNTFVEDPPILSSDIRDSINSAGLHYLEAFNNQVLDRLNSLLDV